MNMVETTAREIARVAQLMPLATLLPPPIPQAVSEALDDAAVALGRGDAIDVIRAYQVLRAIGNAIEHGLTGQEAVASD